MMSIAALWVISLSCFTTIYGSEVNSVERFFINLCAAERREDWSYSGLNGPLFWGVNYPDCYGRQQSPIAIRSRTAVRDENLAKLDLNNYDQPVSQGTVVNNGHTIQVNTDDGVNRTISVNGGEYSLRQLHFHWGDSPKKGSEHTLDRVRYPMEMHLVHMNANSQIAVVGIFFKEQDGNNEELQKLVNQLPEVRYKNDQTPLQSGLNLNNLLPANPTTFYRYQGSLTTPGCSEGVTWSVVPDSIPVGKAQMQEFRRLYSVEQSQALHQCRLVNNYRPLQLLNNRQVFVSQ